MAVLIISGSAGQEKVLNSGKMKHMRVLTPNFTIFAKQL